MVIKDEKLKFIASYLCLITSFLLYQNFDNIVYDTVKQYETVEVFQLQKFQSLPIKIKKVELDIKF